MIFHSWKQSSYSFFTHELWRLFTLFRMSTFFRPPFSYLLQRVLCFILGLELFHKKEVWIVPKALITWIGTGAIRALEGDQMPVCGIRCIDLCNEGIKILGTYFSYNSRIKEERSFLKTASNVQSVLNLSRYRNLTLEGRIVVFKILAISKIIFQALIAPVLFVIYYLCVSKTRICRIYKCVN